MSGDRATLREEIRKGLQEGYDRLMAEQCRLQAWASKHAEEVRACALLMDVLGLDSASGQPWYEITDDGKRQAQHDFTLRPPGGKRIAV